MKAIVIVADGLRPSDIGPYGNEWLPTPNLDRLASQSIVFDQHFADRPTPFTFRARLEFSASEHTYAIALPPGVKCVHYEDLLPPWDPPHTLLEASFEDWEFDDEPTPWLDPQPGWLDPNDALAFDRLRRTHAAAVRQFDDWLGDFVERDADELLIFTSARGQHLGEHGIVGEFRPWLHEELVHLPLMVRLPGCEQAGRRIAHLTHTVDIVATIYEYCGIPKPADWHGHSLLPHCRGGGAIRPYVVMGHSLNGTAEFALQTPEVKVILPTKLLEDDPPRQPMFFIKPDDRWDVNDLRQQNLDYAEQLERMLLDFVAASKRPGPLVTPPLPEPEFNHADRETR
jgi:arylsulfatase A-like enzyme